MRLNKASARWTSRSKQAHVFSDLDRMSWLSRRHLRKPARTWICNSKRPLFFREILPSPGFNRSRAGACVLGWTPEPSGRVQPGLWVKLWVRDYTNTNGAWQRSQAAAVCHPPAREAGWIDTRAIRLRCRNCCL